MLNGELYAQRFQKIIYLHLFTDCFMKISLQSSEPIQLAILKHQHALYVDIWGEGLGLSSFEAASE